MKSTESTVLSRIFNSSCSDYTCTITDVMYAIAHLKSGKSDGSEGLCSDHFIHGTHRFYVILSIFSVISWISFKFYDFRNYDSNS